MTTSTRRARASTHRSTRPEGMQLVKHDGAGSADIITWHFVETPNQSFTQIISIDYAIGGRYAGMAPGVWYTLGTAAGDAALQLDQAVARQAVSPYQTHDEGAVMVSWADAIVLAARRTPLTTVPAATTRRVRAMARMVQRDGNGRHDTLRMTATRLRGTSAYVGLTFDGLALPFAVDVVDVPAHVLHAFFATAGSVPLWGVTDELPHWLSSTRGKYLIGMRAARTTDTYAGRTVVMTALDVPRYNSLWHSAPSEEHLLDGRCGVNVVAAEAEGLRAVTTVASLLDYCEHDENASMSSRRTRAGAATAVMSGMAIAAFGARPRIDSAAPGHGCRRADAGDTLRVPFNPRLLRDVISTYASTTEVLFRTVMPSRQSTRTSMLMPLAIDIGNDTWGVLMPLQYAKHDVDAGMRDASWETIG